MIFILFLFLFILYCLEYMERMNLLPFSYFFSLFAYSTDLFGKNIWICFLFVSTHVRHVSCAITFSNLKLHISKTEPLTHSSPKASLSQLKVTFFFLSFQLNKPKRLESLPSPLFHTPHPFS